jgi:hypoxanthine phosphoribosyltransferase
MMSGLTTSKLIDEKKILSRVKEMGEEITKIARKEDMVLVSVLKGSFMFFADLVRHIDADVRVEFLGCASYGNSMKSSGEVKLTMDLTTSVEGKTVMLIEDIVDTGLTMDYLMKSLQARNPKKVMSCALLLKPDALKTKIKLDYCGFEIGNEFVVGYGLDYQGYYRNLPYIAQVDNLN